MDKFRGKIFNNEVFEKYLKTLPSTQKNALINSAIFTSVNKYKSRMSEQAGGYFVVEPIKGRIGGDELNYDGETDITSTSRDTFYQTKICYGRAKAWGEDDFPSEITGTNFMAEASEVKEYWDEKTQATVLSILKGIFAMTGSNDFASKHTYEIDGNLTADGCNRAAQKALGDAKSDLGVMFVHSAVSTNLEGLNLIEFMKYTDKSGITRDLTIGTYNGKLLIVDDGMPVQNGYDAATESTAGALKVVASGATTGQINLADVKKADFYPATVAANDYVTAGTKYISYMFKNGFFEKEDLGVVTPSELYRDAKSKGGHTDLISRIRKMIVPTYISYKDTTKKSPMNADFEKGANWELANNKETGSVVYVDDKLIPVVRVISRG